MEMTSELKYILSENDRLKSEYDDIGKYTNCCQSFKEGIVQYCNQLKVKLHNFVNTVNLKYSFCLFLIGLILKIHNCKLLNL